jgi:hypothetical protein
VSRVLAMERKEERRGWGGRIEGENIEMGERRE